MNDQREAFPPRVTAQKRQAILAAATSLFLKNGFRGTSMDEVAALARVSKQTVYKQFGDKEALFREIIEAITERSEAIVEALIEAFGTAPIGDAAQLELRLHRMGMVLLDGVLQPNVLALRRLIIAEAEQFPDLASHYYDQAQARAIGAIVECLQPCVDSGLLACEDVREAAAHFAYLSVAISQDAALFLPNAQVTDDQRESRTAAAARVFVAAYHDPVP